MGALIKDVTLTSATGTVTLDLSSTPIQKGELYELTITAIPGWVRLAINGSDTSSTGARQTLLANNATVEAFRNTDGMWLAISGQNSYIKAYLKLTNTGYLVTQSVEMDEETGISDFRTMQIYSTSTTTYTSVTSLGFINGNTFQSGSRFQLRKVGEKINEVEISSATNTVSFTGLNLKKSDKYLLVSNPVYSGSGQSVLYLTANNNDTLTNYYRQVLEVGGTSSTGNRQNNPYMHQIPATPGSNKQSLAVVSLNLTETGNFTYQSNNLYNYTDPNGIYIQKVYGTSTYQTTSITSLKITVQDSTNSIGAGSRFELYKLYEEPVVEPDPDTYELLAEHTVYSPTTQIDIPVNITKDDEVRLVYTFVGDDASNTSNIELRVNDITSNYTIQVLNGDGSSITAFRESNGQFVIARSNRKAVGFADIKVSNNDRFVVQSQFISRAGADSSSITNFNRNLVNTSTVTSITKLSIVSSRTNGIAVGSKIQLFKVN